ncbi:hypothetical protein ACOCJ5_04690 [Knoellia sp. CPCC 206450]|uniref:hypothetical protein n=1 Tax=Knoellia tibetensis TaxID=3404798 RepID=UPI003B43505C
MPSSLLRRACLGAFAASTSLALVTPAQAASAEITYTCGLFALPAGLDVADLGAHGQKLLESAEKGEVAPDALAAEIPEIIEVEGLKVTASFDSAIADGATTTPGSTVELEPLSARFTFDAGVTAELGKLGITEGEAGALLFAGVDETGAEREAEFWFESVSVPGSGAFTLESDDGFAEPFKANAPGEFTYVAGDFSFFLATGDEENGTFAALECVADDDQDLTIDQVTARAEGTTPPPTPEPVRPDVVQTDAAQPASPSMLPLLAAGAGSVVVLGAGSHLLRRRAARR